MFASLLRVLVGLSLAVLLVAGGQALVAQDAKDQDKKEKEKDKEKDKDLRARDPEKEKEREAEKEKEAFDSLMRKAENEYRRYFKRPEKAREFWAAIKFEISVGKFDLAALHLKHLLQLPAEEADKELVKIQEVEGFSNFLLLQTVRQWSDHPPYQAEAEKNVNILLERMATALERNLSDPARLHAFIKGLDSPSAEVQAYAFAQINRSRDRAAPYLVQALEANIEKPRAIQDALTRLDPEVIAPILEVLVAKSPVDAADLGVRNVILDVVRARADTRAIPYLWHLAESAQYPGPIRSKARTTLAYLLKMEADALPPAKLPLTDLAEQHYQRKVRFPAPRLTKQEQKEFAEAHKNQKPVALWQWGAKGLTRQIVPMSKALEVYGLRYARQALQLDPAYQSAQIVFLCLLLEKTYENELDQFIFTKPSPALANLLGSIDAEVLLAVLDRGLRDGNVPVILAAAQLLGDRGETRAVRVTPGSGQNLIRALSFPDRRVQFVAAESVLRLPGAAPRAGATRVVDVLRRLVAAGDAPKMLVAYAAQAKAKELRTAMKGAGYDAVFAANIKEAFAHLHKSADYDAVMLYTPPAADVPHLLSQLRSDSDVGRLPILLVAPKGEQDAFEKMAQKQPYVAVLSEAQAGAEAEVKDAVAGLGARSAGAPLSAKERKELTRASLNHLYRMAVGEMPGYDLRPAQDAVQQAIRSEELGLKAVETLGRIAGQDNQQRLALTALDAAHKLRYPAAVELNRHMQRYGLLLSNQQISAVQTAFRNPQEDAKIKAQLALVLGALHPSAAQTGTSIQQFQADPPAPPMPPEKKEEKKDKNEKD